MITSKRFKRKILPIPPCPPTTNPINCAFALECFVFTVGDYKNKTNFWTETWEKFNNLFIDLVWLTKDNRYIRIDIKKLKCVENRKFNTGIDDKIYCVIDKLDIPVPENADRLFVDFFIPNKRV